MKKFTLIELLVVVAIIGILASLLLPSLGVAREKTKRAVCKSNIKQIGVAMTMYGDNNNGKLPVSTDWATTIKDPSGGLRQMGYFYEYLKVVEIFYCPGMPNTSIGGYNFSLEGNRNVWENNSGWVQAAYSYRKYSDDRNYSLSVLDSETSIITDGHHELWGDRFGTFLHTSDGFNSMYGDTSISWVPDPSQYTISTNWTNVAISLNDTAVWNVLFDRE